MRTVQAATRHMRMLLLPACLAAIILGILGMHAFTHQEPVPLPGTGHGVGTHHAGPPGHHMTVTSAAASTTTSELNAAVGDGRATVTGAGGAAATGMPAHSMGDLVMLCAAMLLAAAGSAVLALRLRRLAATTVTRLKPIAQTFTTTPSLRVGTGPPPNWKFSVIRC